jgi:hypothetical protein
MAEVSGQNDQQAATESATVTVRDIPTRKTLADGSHLLAETTAFLVSSSSSSSSTQVGRTLLG